VKRMFRRVGVMLAAVLLGAGLSAAPAQAAVWHTCPEDYVCLYHWVWYGAPPGDGGVSPGWKSTFYNLSIHSGGCVSLWNPLAKWPDGSNVVHNAGGLVVNGSGAYSSNVTVTAYAYDNCTGPQQGWTADHPTLWGDLGQLLLSDGQPAYHRIASFRIAANCPPPGC